ncbi:MAG: hypothetical protein IJU23_14185 [Proteobacteria bacterium]|nr:hypothetical protein [Pseudomonadota bacterium]
MINKNTVRVSLLLAMSMMFWACSDDSKPTTTDTKPGDVTTPEPKPTDPKDPPAPVQLCGNGQLDADEACDGNLGLPASCSDWNSSKMWAAGGKPACSSDCSQITAGTCIPVTCGNGQVDPDEACDGELGVPTTCSKWDNTVTWVSGGAPQCASDCSAIVAGSCVKAACGQTVCPEGESCFEDECVKSSLICGNRLCQESQTCIDNKCYYETDNPTCGNSKLETGEVCDKTAGVPKTCSEFDSTQPWLDGGKPACASDCSAVIAGTCQRSDERVITFYNYNVLFEYTQWMSESDPFKHSVVIDRATQLYKNLKEVRDDPKDELPAIFAIVETSPQWHDDKVTEMFADLGYEWVDNTNYRDENDPNTIWDSTTLVPGEGAFFHSNMLYQKSRFELVEHDWVSLAPYYAKYSVAGTKTIAFGAVLREIDTGEIFLAFSTHWEANNIYDNDPKLADSIGWVMRHETYRIQGAKDSAAFIANYREKYPNAHVFYGGDLNTIDINILISNPASSLILGSSNQSLANKVNLLIGGAVDDDGEPYPVLGEDFMGAHEVFKTQTGLNDARSTALELGVAVEDTATTHDPGIPDFIKTLEIPVVIDYAFYSPEMSLLKYEVLNAPKYDTVSDHYAVKTQYRYRIHSDKQE